MSANVSAWLDEDRQIIWQRVEGAMSAEDFHRLYAMTEECVSRLRDPHRVYVIIDGRAMEPTSLKVRRHALAQLSPDVAKMAMFGGSRLTRIVGSFLMTAAGNRRIRQFADRETALAWVEQGREER